MKKNGISVVIPVYNSQSTLTELVNRLGQVLSALGESFEVILVDDGSQDHSWEVIQGVSQSFPWVRGINLMRNYGQHNALLCGVRAANFETTITMDDDLQHPPEAISDLLAPLNQGFDVVYGTPLKQQHGLWRNLASYLTRLALQSTMGVENARKVSAYRAMRTHIREAFANYQSPFVTIDVLLTWGTNRFTSVIVEHEPRHGGISHYTFRKLVAFGLNMLTGFTVLPLQLASLMGFAFAMFGLLVLCYVIVRYLIQGGSVPGFPFLASTIAIFSGVQLFALGIIGEYLARMHFRLMERPSYVVRNEIGYKQETTECE